jgi:hypothetical protein
MRDERLWVVLTATDGGMIMIPRERVRSVVRYKDAERCKLLYETPAGAVAEVHIGILHGASMTLEDAFMKMLGG